MIEPIINGNNPVFTNSQKHFEKSERFSLLAFSPNRPTNCSTTVCCQHAAMLSKISVHARTGTAIMVNPLKTYRAFMIKTPKRFLKGFSDGNAELCEEKKESQIMLPNNNSDGAISNVTFIKRQQPMANPEMIRHNGLFAKADIRTIKYNGTAKSSGRLLAPQIIEEYAIALHKEVMIKAEALLA